ncbi:class I SAM-dependent methyltransferase [Candidatus Contubernalis alkaliaceticus]|uniref:class I SAM-dependent methyltransferase n=1 Tax=Candidatus Contubernalis alkaliaceticus TaxID=338645 RepID=UPI001F4C477D|nr:class I SAM-dependent methyltransferase [Candidatus Contubernalis alkalaceticus]UNC93047.1 class I SAM-dependent methyltransferase [Candidatus Contubernalis alkalaceticus]
MENREWFNNLAAEWDSMLTDEKVKILTDIIKRLNIPENSSVLDVGTGTGVLVPWLKEVVGFGGRLVALDYAPEMVAKAREKYGSQAVFLVADVHSLKFSDESFDRVICNSAFPHFSDKPKAMAEMSRILKKGGRLHIIHTSTRDELNKFHSSLDGPVSKDMLPDDEEMAVLIREAKMEKIEIQDGPVFYLMTAGKC